MKTKDQASERPPPGDEKTTIDELKTLVADFGEVRGWTRVHNPKDLAIGLVTEACELLEIFRFKPEAELPRLLADPATRTHVGEELADSLYCILRFAQMNGFDLSECLRAKLITSAVKYPVPTNDRERSATAQTLRSNARPGTD